MIMPDKEYLSWQEYGTAGIEIAEQIKDDDFKPDIILGIARGGLSIACSLGYALDIKNIYMMNVEYYTGENTRLEFPIMLPPYLNIVGLKDKKVLIVDDISDTGGTLKMVLDFLGSKVAETKTAVLYEKDKSLLKCDYVWRRTNMWVEFPWSYFGNTEEKNSMFGFVMTGAPDDPDLEWMKVYETRDWKNKRFYKCQAAFGWKETGIYYSDGTAIPIENCEGLFVGELTLID